MVSLGLPCIGKVMDGLRSVSIPVARLVLIVSMLELTTFLIIACWFTRTALVDSSAPIALDTEDVRRENVQEKRGERACLPRACSQQRIDPNASLALTKLPMTTFSYEVHCEMTRASAG